MFSRKSDHPDDCRKFAKGENDNFNFDNGKEDLSAELNENDALGTATLQIFTDLPVASPFELQEQQQGCDGVYSVAQMPADALQDSPAKATGMYRKALVSELAKISSHAIDCMWLVIA